MSTSNFRTSQILPRNSHGFSMVRSPSQGRGHGCLEPSRDGENAPGPGLWRGLRGALGYLGVEIWELWVFYNMFFYVKSLR